MKPSESPVVQNRTRLHELFKRFDQLLWQGSESTLIPFCIMNFDEHLIEIDVFYTHSQAFADPHPAAVEQLPDNQVNASQKGQNPNNFGFEGATSPSTARSVK